MKLAYLDNSATTAVCPQAIDKATYMMRECFGNPSSLHAVGFAAERELEEARRQIAALLGARPDTIVFTSGGTEANNLAILGGALTRQRSGRHTVTTAVEHASVAAAFSELERQGFACERLAAGADGGITAAAGHRLPAREDTVLVSIMLVNNETGAVFPSRRSSLRYAVPHHRRSFTATPCRRPASCPSGWKAWTWIC